MTTSFFDSPLYGPLFGDAELGDVLSDQNFVDRMVLFERKLAFVQGDLGVIPKAAGSGIDAGLANVQIAPAALAEGLASSGVPVPALVAALRKELPGDVGQWLHWGATSQDVIDTANVLGSRDALDVIAGRLALLVDALAAKSRKYADTMMAGRTRSQIATPITFGLRIAQWAQPLIALENDLGQLGADVLPVQFGGASGANTAIAPHGPAIASGLADALGLADAPPWHANQNGPLKLAGWLLSLHIALSKVAGDLILMSRTEIGEAQAGIGGGSSTMPQKSNPVGPETICVLATMAQAAHGGLAASAVHAEERDGANWPVAWTLLPQMLLTGGRCVLLGVDLVNSLTANADRMQQNLDDNSGVMAEQASFVLADQMPRAEAQVLVKTALATGKPLALGLAEVSDLKIDWAEILNPAMMVASCRNTANQIFTQRKS